MSEVLFAKGVLFRYKDGVGVTLGGSSCLLITDREDGTGQDIVPGDIPDTVEVIPNAYLLSIQYRLIIQGILAGIYAVPSEVTNLSQGNVQFQFFGERYVYPRSARLRNRIVLPDGRLLRVNTWEGLPPIPVQLYFDDFVMFAQRDE